MKELDLTVEMIINAVQQQKKL